MTADADAPLIAVVGEAVADAVLPHEAAGPLQLTVRPGGSPANVAVGLARLGTRTQFLGRLSTGPLGEVLRQHLAESQVDLSMSVAAAQPASLAITSVDGEGAARYDFYLTGTADWQWDPAELTDWNEPAVAIHSGSLALLLPPGAPVITDFVARHRDRATICIDPNVRPGIASIDTYREVFDRWAGIADIIKVSNEDLSHVYPDSAVPELLREWHSRGVRLIVVTAGAGGALASLDGATQQTEAPTVAVADTIGAGDAFTAGLLHQLAADGQLGGRLDNLDEAALHRALLFATRVAAQVCTVPGADPPWAQQLRPSLNSLQAG
jgi:fructokinase